MNAYRQIHVVEIRTRIEAHERVAVEINHAQLRVLRERPLEVEIIQVMALAVYRRDIQNDGVLTMVYLYVLTVHLELCAYLRQGLAIVRDIDDVVIVSRIEGEVCVQRALEVLKAAAVQGDIR